GDPFKWSPDEIDLVDQINGRDVFSSGPLRLLPSNDATRTKELWAGPRIKLSPINKLASQLLRVADGNRGGDMVRLHI
ncbi:MAG: hypothetical protein WC670_17555, partial [Pseudolabrys sp.]